MSEQLLDIPHYSVLGIEPTASNAELKKAYHRIARKHHPDRGQDGDVDIFKAATVSYEFLKDSSRRDAYDAQLRRETLVKAWRTPQRAGPSRNYTRDPTRPATSFASSAASTAFASSQFATAEFVSAAFEFPLSPDQDFIHGKYTRRPRETRFSKYEEPLSNEEAVHLDEDLRQQERLQKYANKKAKKFKSKASSLHTQPNRQSCQSSNLDSSPVLEHQGTKRGSDGQEPTAKRQRVFDMSDMNSVPPFTQTNGAFKLDKLGQAIPSLPRSSRRRASDGFAANGPAFSEDVDTALYLKNLLKTFNSEAASLINSHTLLHNSRLKLDSSSPEKVLNNLETSLQVLENLVIGTRNAANIFREASHDPIHSSS